MKRQKNYDKKVKQTRILLNDYLALKQMSQVAGVSMAEALHRLIEHQAQLPMLDMAAKPISVYRVAAGVVPSQVAAGVMPGRVTAVTRVMPGRVTGNGIGHIRPKIIRGVS